MQKDMRSSHEVLSTAEQAEKLRQDGNTYFKKDRLGAAIEAYTEAITLCPNVPVYWTNRALCHRKRKWVLEETFFPLIVGFWNFLFLFCRDWVRLEEDCRRAIQLDGSSVKAHYMLGLALLEKEQYGEGVMELEKALNLGRGADPKGYMVEEIWRELSNAKYLEWEQASTKRSWELQNLKEICELALKQKHIFDYCDIEGFVDGSAKSNKEQLEALKQVFNKVAEGDMPREIPDYLCCKITFDIYRDPVITPSGITYERKVLLDHLNKVGNFDPVTREPLYPSQLIPNLAIKEAVQAFLDQNGWAYRVES